MVNSARVLDGVEPFPACLWADLLGDVCLPPHYHMVNSDPFAIIFLFVRTVRALRFKATLAFGKTLEADLAEVSVRSVTNPIALLILRLASLSNSFASYGWFGVLRTT